MYLKVTETRPWCVEADDGRQAHDFIQAHRRYNRPVFGPEFEFDVGGERCAFGESITAFDYALDVRQLLVDLAAVDVEGYAALLNERLDERIEQARRYGGVGGDRARPAGPLAVVGDVEQERDALVAALEGQRTSWQAHYQPPERKSGEELLEQVCTGSQFEPGVYVGEDGRLAAWAPTVLPELEQEPEGIWVTQDDLAGDVHAQPR